MHVKSISIFFTAIFIIMYMQFTKNMSTGKLGKQEQFGLLPLIFDII